MYGWVNKRRRLLARLHKTVNSTGVLSAVASLNEDRLIALKAQIKLSKHIIRSNGEPSRQSDCKICLKIFYSPFSLHLPMFIRNGLISLIILALFVASLLNNKIKTNTPFADSPKSWAARAYSGTAFGILCKPCLINHLLQLACYHHHCFGCSHNAENYLQRKIVQKK